MTEPYPKIYLYKRIVQAKLFIDNHYAEKIENEASDWKRRGHEHKLQIGIIG